MTRAHRYWLYSIVWLIGYTWECLCELGACR